MSEHPELSSISGPNLFQYIDRLKESLTASVDSSIKNLITPLQAQQHTLNQHLHTTVDKLRNLEMARSQAKDDVSSLQNMVSQLRAEFLQKNNAFTGTSPQTSSDQINQPRPHNNYNTLFLQAKKTLGFGPVLRNDVLNHMKQLSITYEQALASSVCSFLNTEMDIPADIVRNLVIVKAFYSLNDESNSCMLFAEFDQPSSIELVQQYARNLKKGRKMSLYVPSEFKRSFSLYNKLAYEYRNGEIRHKTRLMYGENDFVLLVKPLDGSQSWSTVKYEALPLNTVASQHDLDTVIPQ